MAHWMENGNRPKKSEGFGQKSAPLGQKSAPLGQKSEQGGQTEATRLQNAKLQIIGCNTKILGIIWLFTEKKLLLQA
ncbi:MAG: hypothetical protein K5896_06680 [Prevotella sp.]|nr:hypothetical protein [Prevotella sp.]